VAHFFFMVEEVEPIACLSLLDILLITFCARAR